MVSDMKLLIFANGRPNDGPMVRLNLEQAPDAYILAADGGARVAYYFGLRAQTVIGDMDSLTADEVRQLEERNVEILRHVPEKDQSDLELALMLAAERGFDWIRIIGGLGGRFDQMLANAYLLALPQLVERDVALIAGKQYICLLRPGTHQVTGDVGDTISLLPISGTVTGITTTGLQYPLRNEALYFGPARGISNVMLADTATIALQNGNLLLIHTKGRA